jgi:hypothetical protein
VSSGNASGSGSAYLSHPRRIYSLPSAARRS